MANRLVQFIQIDFSFRLMDIYRPLSLKIIMIKVEKVKKIMDIVLELFEKVS